MTVFETRIQNVRRWMRSQGLDLYVMPHDGPFLLEQLQPAEEKLAWLTGFTGSNGVCLITQSRVLLATDGRYTLQAEQQTGRFISSALYTHQTVAHWLTSALKDLKNPVLGVDGECIPWVDPVRISGRWLNELSKRLNFSVRYLPSDHIQEIAENDFPDVQRNKLVEYPLELHHDPVDSKLERLCDSLQTFDQGLGLSYLVCCPTASAWLLNVRGSDVQHAPIPFTRLLLNSAQGEKGLTARWYVAEECIADIDRPSWVLIRSPQSLLHDLQQLPRQQSVVFDATRTPALFASLLQQQGHRCVELEPPQHDPLSLLRSTLNRTQTQWMKKGHEWDAVAMCRFLSRLEAHDITQQPLDEKTLTIWLEESRQMSPHYQGPSFNAIVGSGEHGAVIHYRVSEDSNRKIGIDDLILLDSGGQYTGATTDITRTVAVDPKRQSASIIRDYTAVLKGVIALSNQTFPLKTTGAALDALARQHLWQERMDFAHGTGHGVNQNFDVHDGIQSISPHSKQSLKPGMVISIEPGVYQTGRYGIRLENLVQVIQADGKTPQENQETSSWLRFEPLTFVPFCLPLIDPAMLTVPELAWLNAYHQQCYAMVEPLLDPAETAYTWLKRFSCPLPLIS